MIYRPGEIEHRRAARRQQRLPELARRAAQLREVSAVGRVVSVDRHDGASGPSPMRIVRYIATFLGGDDFGTCRLSRRPCRRR